MLPIGPLMAEHRLIERMIKILKIEIESIKKFNEINETLIDNVVDFIRIYADQTHHGKEEDILFRELKQKKITEEHNKIMEELINEHIFGRRITGELVEAKKNYIKGDKNAILDVIEKIDILTGFYPKHIEKEDKHFFIPVMDYFTKAERDAMLNEGQEFDRRMIHRKYDQLIESLEEKHNIKGPQKSDWIDYL